MPKIKVERLVKVHGGERGKRETDTQEFFEWNIEKEDSKLNLIFHTETGNYRINLKEMVKVLLALLGMNMD